MDKTVSILNFIGINLGASVIILILFKKNNIGFINNSFLIHISLHLDCLDSVMTNGKHALLELVFAASLLSIWY